MNPLVSIITISLNGEKTITKTLEAILAQTYKNIEYIIVDGASKDNTVLLVQSYSDKFYARNISYKLVSEPDEGIYDAMNKGIKMASGEIVGIINNGDWYEPDTIAKVVETYNATHFDLMFATVRIYKGNAVLLKKPKLTGFQSSRHWNHPTMFVTKAVYNQEQYACDCIYDDFDFYLRLHRQNRKIVIIDDVLANFQFGGISNQKSLSKMLERVNIRYSVYRKNGYSKLYIFECLLTEFAKFIFA